MAECHVYILKCSDGSYYTGITHDLRLRLAEHEAGEGCDWTLRRRPVALAWSESFPDREAAAAVERQVKGWTRAKKEALIDGRYDGLHELARRRSGSSNRPHDAD